MLSFLDILVPVGGFIGGLVSATSKRNHEFKLAALRAKKEDVQAARENNNEWISWTRRTIALTATFFVFIGPLLAMFYGYPTWVAYPETNGLLFQLFTGEVTIVWKQLPEGFIMTPLHRYAFEAIIGFYFGGK